MSVSQIMNGAEVALRVIPDLRPLGYSNEMAGRETEHITITKQRLQLLETKVAALEARPGGGGTDENNGGGSGVSQADFLNLLQTVNSQSQLIDQLVIKLNYAFNYLKMIDEAIAVEGFDGWTPPTFD